MAETRPANRAPVLLLLAFSAVVALAVVYVIAVRTHAGQRLDATALSGRDALRPRTINVAGDLLDTISVASLVLVGGLIVLVALLRLRPLLALGAGLVIAGSVFTTEVLKKGELPRPYLGVHDPLGLVPSFPSGHTTVAFSLAVAAMLVAPSRLRVPVGLLGALYASGIGVAVVATANHRPSDPIGAAFVVTAWGAAVAALLCIVSINTFRDRRRRSGIPLLAIGATLLLAVGFVGVVGTAAAIRADRLGTVAITGAFAGACAAVVGTLMVTMVALLASLRGVSPEPAEPDPLDDFEEVAIWR